MIVCTKMPGEKRTNDFVRCEIVILLRLRLSCVVSGTRVTAVCGTPTLKCMLSAEAQSVVTVHSKHWSLLISKRVSSVCGRAHLAPRRQPAAPACATVRAGRTPASCQTPSRRRRSRRARRRRPATSPFGSATARRSRESHAAGRQRNLPRGARVCLDANPATVHNPKHTRLVREASMRELRTDERGMTKQRDCSASTHVADRGSRFPTHVRPCRFLETLSWWLCSEVHYDVRNQPPSEAGRRDINCS